LPVGITGKPDINRRGVPNPLAFAAPRLTSGLFYVEMAQTVSKERDRRQVTGDR